MDGIQVIKDTSGKLTEIRIDAVTHPELAEEIYHLLAAVSRAKETEKSLVFKSSRISNGSGKAMDLTSFNELIRASKESGELTKEEFFARYPKWLKKEKSYLQN
ncbi:MAG: hypothetical protein AAGD28_01855 [Bacteroidota bacterium]